MGAKKYIFKKVQIFSDEFNLLLSPMHIQDFGRFTAESL